MFTKYFFTCFITGNLSEIIVICTESGIWQPISFQCVFDPTAVNLKDGASFGKFLPLRCVNISLG